MVDTVREPLMVLDKDLRVIAASQSFYVTFTTNPDNSRGKHLYELGDGQWDIPKLRALLENIIPGRREMDDYEVEQDFPRIGKRVLLLNACIVLYEKGHKNILLSIEDLTVQRALEHDKDELLRQKDVLLDEIEDRVANSLQIIASIIMLKAKSVDSEETRRHLHDAHNRVISVAAVQRHLHASAGLGSMEMLPYLTTLCGALTHSMIGDGQSISLKVIGEGGSSTCANAESLGLIVTELVINALKHAFHEKTKDGQITVAYDVFGTDWKLSVADNGMGKPDGVFAQPKSGLGTGIVKALAKQLDSQVVTSSGPKGTTVSVTHATLRGPRGTIGSCELIAKSAQLSMETERWRKRVTLILFVGQKPETVDFSDPALPPGFDAEKINAGIAVAAAKIGERGWRGDTCMITPDEAGRAMLEKTLKGAAYDCVVVGGGLRIPPKSLALFEMVVNAVHKTAPGAKIAFNTRPEDTAEAAARQLNAG